MSLNFIQFHAGVVVPALQSLEPHIKFSPDADVLVSETIWHESARLTALGQFPRAGVTEQNPFSAGLGVASIERDTWDWMKYETTIGKEFLVDHYYDCLAWNLHLNVIACRLRYYLDKEPLPPGDLSDSDALAARAVYWLRVYNGSQVWERKTAYITNAKAIPWERT